MSKFVEITGILLSEKRPPQCDDFFIAQIKVVGGELDGQIVCAVGNCDEGELRVQQTYRWFGTWKNDPKWGRQLAVATFVVATPHNRQSVVRYLEENCDGIGRATAEQLWNKFGADAVRVCRESPELVASTVSRLNLDRCLANAEKLKAAHALEGVSIELIDFFTGHNIPRSVHREALRRYGNKAVALFNRNPFLLLNFRGVGFLKADSVYLKLGLPPDRLKRQVLCLANELKGLDDTWVQESAADTVLKSKISGHAASIAGTLKLGLRAKRFSAMRRCTGCRGTGRGKVPDLFTGDTLVDGPCGSCCGTGGQRWVALEQRATNERIIAEKVAALLRAAPEWPDVGRIKRASDHQRAGAVAAFRGALGCLIGGPGTGKSFLTAAVAAALIDKFGWENVAAAAPTNKASVRLTQGFQANDINLRATSIHSLLGVDKVEDGHWTFKHTRKNPLPYRVILLDEGSMLNTDLGACVFDAILPGTLVLLIGDTCQLPPIQHGAVLRDLLTAGVPTGVLTEPQRNAGDLVFACDDIRRGVRFRESDAIDLKGVPPRNFKFIAARTPDEQIDELMKLLDWAKQYGLDPVWDCQVMSTVNRTSKVSKDELNKLMQRRFNPDGEGNIRPRDKVINTENGLYKVARLTRSGAGRWTPEGDYDNADEFDGDDEKVFIAKGEFGQVVSVAKKELVVRFDGDNRTVVVPLGRERKTSAAGDAPTEQSCAVSLAYSATIHSMQGSECKLAIPMVDESPGAPWLACRELFFTAISRGKLLTRPIGQRSAADAMCRKVSIDRRKTFLAELITEQIGGSSCPASLAAAGSSPSIKSPPTGTSLSATSGSSITECDDDSLCSESLSVVGS